ncbi:MAG: hypothetical protein ACK41W_11315 [Cyanobacteriota bacterium]
MGTPTTPGETENGLMVSFNDVPRTFAMEVAAEGWEELLELRFSLEE